MISPATARALAMRVRNQAERSARIIAPQLAAQIGARAPIDKIEKTLQQIFVIELVDLLTLFECQPEN
jgi:uncharacterized membrane protein